MNKNTYTGSALAACLCFASMPLLAEDTPAAVSAAPETKIIEPLELSELQREQAEHNKAISK